MAASIKTIVFTGVKLATLSKHLRSNGVKIKSTEEAATAGMGGGRMVLRSDLGEAALLQLAQQLPGCIAEFSQ